MTLLVKQPVMQVVNISKYQVHRSGMTLIEVLLVISIFVIVIVAATSLLTTTTTQQDLGAKTKELTSLIDQARNYSISGYYGDVWGIKVLSSSSDCSNSGDCVVLYKGKTYSSRNKTYDRFLNLTTGVKLLNSGQANEFYFSPIAGWLSTTSPSALTEQGIVLKISNGQQMTVSTTPAGLIYYGAY